MPYGTRQFVALCQRVARIALFRAKRLNLQWQRENLAWVEFDNRLLKHSITGDPAVELVHIDLLDAGGDLIAPCSQPLDLLPPGGLLSRVGFQDRIPNRNTRSRSRSLDET